MQKHLTQESKSINDSFTLPVIDEQTVENFDKDTLLATIIRRYSTLPVLYDDPDWFYDECSAWWDENKFAFAKMWLAIEQEYDPLRNYDRTEHSETTPGVVDTVVNSGADTTTKTGTETSAKTGTDTAAKTGHDDLERQGKTISDTDTLNRSKETVENKVSAFNENNYQPSSQTTSQKDYTLNGDVVPDNTHNEISHQNDKDVQTYGSTDTLTHNTTDTLTHNTTDTLTRNTTTTTSHNGKEERDLHSFGNIGITTSQHMLEKELLLRKTYNLYKIMANTFADDLCLGIW